MTLRDITTNSVHAALAEYDDLGQEEFLRRYGFRRSRKFELIHNGRSYDSKAIAGAAHQHATGRPLSAQEFNGGQQTTRPLLALGFDIRDTSVRGIPATTGSIGAVDGVAEGATFPSRQAVRDAGVHRALQAGIVGTGQTGAESVVVSGGYEDDEDSGWLIVYTGHGGRDESGRQVADQDFDASGNAALLASKLTGAPVRVIRGAHRGSLNAPDTGYRYDGLYRVEDAWRERGRSGHLICRFRMVEFDSPVVDSGLHDTIQEPGPVPAGQAAPGRKATTASRVVRSLAVADYVKRLHEHRCQTCDITLTIGSRRYAEAAHIRALGRPHNGPDSVQNLLCLCPNCHVLFDNGALVIDEGLDIYVNGNPTGRAVRTDARHVIDMAHINYHRSVHQ